MRWQNFGRTANGFAQERRGVLTPRSVPKTSQHPPESHHEAQTAHDATDGRMHDEAHDLGRREYAHVHEAMGLQVLDEPST
jgi:hypothetical protein